MARFPESMDQDNLARDRGTNLEAQDKTRIQMMPQDCTQIQDEHKIQAQANQMHTASTRATSLSELSRSASHHGNGSLQKQN
jgi:hypothetical protein